MYREILMGGKIKQICIRCGNADKRILAAHHLDRNRKNNNLKNLIWLCLNCHFLIHHDKVEDGKLMEALV